MSSDVKAQAQVLVLEKEVESLQNQADKQEIILGGLQKELDHILTMLNFLDREGITRAEKALEAKPKC